MYLPSRGEFKEGASRGNLLPVYREMILGDANKIAF